MSAGSPSSSSLKERALDLYEASLNVPPSKDLGRRTGKRMELRRMVKTAVISATEKQAPKPVDALGRTLEEIKVSSQRSSPVLEPKSPPFRGESDSPTPSPVVEAQTPPNSSPPSNLRPRPVAAPPKESPPQPKRRDDLEKEKEKDEELDVVCRGSKFLMRPFRESDAPSLARNANDLEVSRFLRLRFPSPYTLEDAKAWLALRSSDSQPHAHLAIVVGGECCGGMSVDLPAQGEVDSRNAEIGYWLATSHSGQGITTEALKLFEEHIWRAFPHIVNLTANIFAENKASARVLWKRGFVLCGTFPSFYFKHGKMHDAAFYIKPRPASSLR